MADVVLSADRDGAGIITINRPSARNALSNEVLSAIGEALQDHLANASVDVVVITGSGNKAFAAGGDIREIRDRRPLDAFGRTNHELCNAVAASAKPTIAAINGDALGGGCELAMACDLRIASSGARLGLPEVGLGIMPGAGGTQRLTQLVGAGRAMDLILTGRIIEAAEALDIGLLTRITTTDVVDAALEIAAVIGGKAPLAVRLARAAVRVGSEKVGGAAAYELERVAMAVLYASSDKEEGATAFLDGRTPRFKGH